MSAKHYASLLQKCTELHRGREIHEAIIESGLGSNTFIGNHLVKMYGECGCIEEAYSAFTRINNRNVFSWTILLVTNARKGHFIKAEEVFKLMPARSAVSFTSMLASYFQHGHVEKARSLFEILPEKDVITWNNVITGYAQNGQPRLALEMFKSMLLDGTKPSEVSFLASLEAAADLESLSEGQSLHKLVSSLESSSKIGNALIHMYSMCYRPDEAKMQFERLSAPDVPSWNTLIAMLTRNGLYSDAVTEWQQMLMNGLDTDWITAASVAEACGLASDLVTARLLHKVCSENGSISNARVATAVVEMYGKCGALKEAVNIFKTVSEPDVALFTAMIAAYGRNSCARQALLCLKKMDQGGVIPNEITLTNAMEICGSIPSLSEGKAVHSSIEHILESSNNDIVNPSTKLWNTLLSMYSKCGSIKATELVFRQLRRRDTVSWNTLLTAYGDSNHVLELIKLMALDGIPPNEASFTCVLSACSQNGLLEDGICCFVSVEEDYYMKPCLEHYRCMVDILGRAGRITQAEQLIKLVGLSMDDVSWNSFLAACRMHWEVDLAAKAADKLVVLDPRNSASYVVLSSLYASPQERN